MTSKDGLART
jgi:hypothetical protein